MNGARHFVLVPKAKGHGTQIAEILGDVAIRRWDEDRKTWMYASQLGALEIVAVCFHEDPRFSDIAAAERCALRPITIETTLYHWNEMHRRSCEMQRLTGATVALVMNGSEPRGEQLLELRGLLKRAIDSFKAAESMLSGVGRETPKSEVASFAPAVP